MKYRYLLMDWDGCLANTLAVWMGGYIETFKKYELFPTEAEIVNVAFGDYDGPVKLGLNRNNLESFFSDLMIKVIEGLKNVDLHEGVYDVITKLNEKGVEMAIVTSSKRDSVVPALERTGIDKYIKFIVDADDVENHKPDPESIYLAIDKLDAIRDKTIIVGDSAKDLIAGEAAHIDTIVFYPEINKRFYTDEYWEDAKPTFMIDTFSRVKDIVLEGSLK